LIRIAASGGGIDGTFKSGEAQLNLNEYTGLPGFARLAVTPQDKIVVAVTRDARGDADLSDVWVFRLNADGSRDQTFASMGGPVFQAPSENLWASDVAVQPDGKVMIVTGRSPRNAPGPLIDTMKWALHRVEAGGERDATFGDNGTVLAGDGVYRIGHDPQLALMPNGDAVVATYMPNPSYISRRTALARYHAGALSPNLPGVSLNAGVLLYLGSEGDDQVSVWDDGAGGIVVWLDGETQTFDKSQVQAIEMWGMGGNDLLKVHPLLNLGRAQLMGGDGNDRLIGGAGNDLLYGGAGDDHMTGNGGDDFLDGEAGADTMLGGAGKDTASYADRTANLIVGLDGFADDGEAGELDLAYLDIERVEGGFGNDRIGGSASNNELYGYDGNDTISGGGGADALFGAAGNDKMDGGDGSDYLEGGAGHDTLYGGAGSDILVGLAGNDRLLSDGDDAKDTVSGGTGTDFAEVDLTDVLQGIETFRVATP
jgi:Ca2+-binding RTX toxin-like protein